jgi:two-component system, chemotaxis family, sensor kinase CheA
VPEVAETLKAKAMLLIQRERELYALRLAREQMRAWLVAFHRLSANARPDAGLSTCAEWTAAMIEERHFQTAAAYQYDASVGDLLLVHGQSHAAQPERISLQQGGQRVLRKDPEGFFNRSSDPDLIELSQSLGLQCFLWFLFQNGEGREMLLVAGVATGVGGGQGAVVQDDLVYFTMLGRHLAVLLSNDALITALGSAKRNMQELFDHMRQAIVAFDATGSVRGVSSRQAKVLFDREDLEGCSVRELLYPQAPSYDVDATSFDEWTDLALGAPVEEWPLCEKYAPREAVLHTRNGASLTLELEFRPLVRDGTVSQLMLLATDVSVARRLEDVVQTQEAEHAMRLATMRRLIAGGPQVFLTFLDTARARIDRCEAVVRDHPRMLPIEGIDELFRQVHTVRGEARAFELVDLEAATTALEQTLDEFRNAARGAGLLPFESVTARLEAGLRLARAALEQGREMLVDASPAGTAALDQTTVQRSALRELIDFARDRSDPIGRLVARLLAVPFGTVAAGAVESASTWAAAEGNLVSLRVAPRELLLPEDLARVLPGVLTHLVRNAIAHGIEAPEERLAAGKAEHGSIGILAEETPGGIRVSVEDDGRGLDVDRILACVEGADRGGADVTDLVFLPGLTTRAGRDALAGAGVGLDAVRRDLAKIGYDVRVRFARGRWTRFEIVPVDADREHGEGAAWTR